MESDLRKISWAIDLFANAEIQCAARSAIRLMVGESKTPVEPIYVLNQSPIGHSPLSHKSVQQIETLARERFETLCDPQMLAQTLPLRIIKGSFLTRHAGAQALISEAISIESDLIVASTHAKTGLPRWFSGSFSESLMLYSTLPLLIVNPLWSRTLNAKGGILFPTDFSKESKAAFSLVLDLAQRTKNKLTIFHKIPFLLTPVFELAGFPAYNEVYETQVEVAHFTGTQWIEEAEKRGINARLEIQPKLSGSPAMAILEFAGKSDSLIAMAARSGPIAAALLGSTTREVVRGATLPVWVVHPRMADRSGINPLSESA